MKSTHRKLVPLLAAFLLVFGAWSVAAKTTVTMVTHWNTEVGHGALLAQYVDEFNASQDEIEVILRFDSAASNPEKIILWAAGGSMPDILPISQSFLADFTRAGLLLELPDDAVQAIHDAFLPGAVSLASYGGKVWGYPTENQLNAFTYDTVEFENKGLQPVFPDTWDDLAETAKRLTTYSGDGTIAKAGLGWSLGLRQDVGLLLALSWANGGEVFSPDETSITLNDPAVVNAVQFLVDLISENAIAFGGDHAHGLQAIRWVPGPWVRSSIVNARGPERLAEIHSARIPLGSSGQRFVPNYGWLLTVTSTSTQSDAAIKFLEWLTIAETENGTTRMGDVTALLGSIPNTPGDVAHQPNLHEGFLRGFVEAMAYSETRPWPTPPNTPNVLAAMANELAAIFRGQKTPAQGLADAQIRVQDLIEDALSQ